MRAIAFAVLVTGLAGPALGQDAASPADVCLTNACATAAATAASAGTVADAIRSGDPARVRALGGSPLEALRADMARLEAKAQGSDISQALDFNRRFMDLSDGSSLRFTQAPDDDRLAVERRSPSGRVEVFFIDD